MQPTVRSSASDDRLRNGTPNDDVPAAMYSTQVLRRWPAAVNAKIERPVSRRRWAVRDSPAMCRCRRRRLRTDPLRANNAGSASRYFSNEVLSDRPPSPAKGGTRRSARTKSTYFGIASTSLSVLVSASDTYSFNHLAQRKIDAPGVRYGVMETRVHQERIQSDQRGRRRVSAPFGGNTHLLARRSSA